MVISNGGSTSFPQANFPIGLSPHANESRYGGVYTVEPHPLPPTFAFAANASTYLAVKYNIQASFQLAGEKHAFTAELPEQLVVLPRSLEQPPVHLMEITKAPIKVTDSRLPGGSEPKPKSSFRRGFADKFSSSSPGIEVALKASLPTTVATGGTFPIQLLIQIDSRSTPSGSIPYINIRVTEINLYQRPFLRSLLVADGGHGHRVVESKCEEAVPLNTLPSACKAQQASGSSGDKKICTYSAEFESRVPGTTCPTFSTVNVNQRFRIRMLVEIDICGKAMGFEVDVPEVVIVPPS